MTAHTAEWIRDCESRDEIVTLLEEALRPGNSGWLRSEQPSIFSIAATGMLCGIRAGDHIAAGAACVPRLASTPRGRLTVGLIGAVATAAADRGHGHAAAALDHCEEWLREEGCAAALLWADVPDFYQKRGYVEAGTECVIYVPKFGGLDSAGTCELYHPDLLHDVERVRARETARTDRPRAESEHHYQFSGTSVFVYKECSGRVSAYAAIGRGGDLENVIHECGGSAQGIFALISHIINIKNMDAAVWLVSPHRADLLEIARDAGFLVDTGHLGMVKCLDRAALAAPLCLQLPPDVKLTAGPDGVEFSRGASNCKFTDAELVRAVFGWRDSRVEIARLETSLELPPESLQSLVPAFGGFDSV